jgi:hypothetical protein
MKKIIIMENKSLKALLPNDKTGTQGKLLILSMVILQIDNKCFTVSDGVLKAVQL